MNSEIAIQTFDEQDFFNAHTSLFIKFAKSSKSF